MKSWFQDNNVEMYSTHSDGKSVAADKFIRNLKNKTYKYMTSVSQNVQIDKLNNIVDKYSNTYQSTIKVKSTDVKSSTCIDFNVKSNHKYPKFIVGEHVRKSKYKKIFAQCYTPIWPDD